MELLKCRLTFWFINNVSVFCYRVHETTLTYRHFEVSLCFLQVCEIELYPVCMKILSSGVTEL
jgi:hypothetical protein